MKKTVALIYGGAGAEREVSVMGYRNLVRYFDREKYDVREVLIEKSGDWYLRRGDESYPTFPVRMGGCSGLLYLDSVMKLDVAYPLLHGDFGEDGCIQGALATAGIPFVGEGVMSGAASADKSLTKAVASSLGIPTARGFTALQNDGADKTVRAAEDMLGYPVFVKPTSLGSSVGAARASCREELIVALRNAWSVSKTALVEELIEPKRELECSFLHTDGRDVITPPGEVRIGGFYDYRSKYMKKTVTVPIADVDESVKEQVRSYAAKLVRALGISVMARIDFFLSGERVIFNEINTMPGATAESLYFRMLAANGYPTERVLDILIEQSEVRR